MVTYAEDNPYPSILLVEQDQDTIDETLPAAGQRRLVVGLDDLLYLVDDTGTATLVGAAAGLTDPMTTRGDIIVRNASNVTARLARGSADTYLGSDGTDVAYSAVTDAKLSTSDITTNNASTSKHGFLKKLSNVATEYMDGTGAWSTPAGAAAGALVLIEQHAASTSATLDFTTFISSTYDEYIFELLGILPATDNVNLFCRAGTGGGPTYDTGNNYASSGMRWSNSGSAVAGSATGSAFGLDVSGGIDNGSSRALSGSLRLFMPQSTGVLPRVTWQTSYTDNANLPLGCTGNGQYIGGSAMTAVRFAFSSGNITSGTIRVYGVAK